MKKPGTEGMRDVRLIRSRAEKVAEAMLEPHLRAQEERTAAIQDTRTLKSLYRTRMRRVGLFAIVVGAIAASISYFFSHGLADGFISGSSVGAAIGLIAARRSR